MLVRHVTLIVFIETLIYQAFNSRNCTIWRYSNSVSTWIRRWTLTRYQVSYLTRHEISTSRNHQCHLSCFITQGLQFDFRVPWSTKALRLTITNTTRQLSIRSTDTEAICTAQIFYRHVFVRRQTTQLPLFRSCKSNLSCHNASPAYPINTVRDPSSDIVAARAHVVKAPTRETAEQKSPHDQTDKETTFVVLRRDDVCNLHLSYLHKPFAERDALLK